MFILLQVKKNGKNCVGKLDSVEPSISIRCAFEVFPTNKGFFGYIPHELEAFNGSKTGFNFNSSTNKCHYGGTHFQQTLKKRQQLRHGYCHWNLRS
jgi:hypothetical protein